MDVATPMRKVDYLISHFLARVIFLVLEVAAVVIFASIAFGMWEGFAVLAIAGTLIRLVTYCICAAALPVLEHREGMVQPFHALCSVLAIAVSLFVAAQVDTKAILVLAGMIGLGAVFYFIAGRNAAQTELPVV